MALTDYAAMGNARTAKVLDAAYALQLAERSEAIIPRLMPSYRGAITGRGSKVLKLVAQSLDGVNLPGSVGENASTTPTAMTPTTVDVTPGRYSFAVDVSDLAALTDPTDALSLQRLALSMFRGQNQKIIELVTALASGFTASVGNTASALTYSDLLSAITKLEENDAGESPTIILHSTQWGAVREDLMNNSGGAIQFSQAAQEVSQVLGSGFKGTLNGAAIYTTNRVAAVAGAHQGMIFSANAFGWADAEVAVEDPNNQFRVGNMLVDRFRTKLASTEYLGHFWFGVSEFLDGAGCMITSAA